MSWPLCGQTSHCAARVLDFWTVATICQTRATGPKLLDFVVAARPTARDLPRRRPAGRPKTRAILVFLARELECQNSVRRHVWRSAVGARFPRGREDAASVKVKMSKNVHIHAYLTPSRGQKIEGARCDGGPACSPIDNLASPVAKAYSPANSIGRAPTPLAAKRGHL